MSWVSLTKGKGGIGKTGVPPRSKRKEAGLLCNGHARILLLPLGGRQGEGAGPDRLYTFLYTLISPLP